MQQKLQNIEEVLKIVTTGVEEATQILELLGQDMRTGITVFNCLDCQIDVQIQKEIIADCGTFVKIQPGKSDRWGRNAGTYEIQIVHGKDMAKIKLTKEDKESAIIVSFEDGIKIYSAKWEKITEDILTKKD